MAEHACSPVMENFLRELPKCENHVHLEGTLEPSLLYQLAERNNITLPSSFPKSTEECEERYANFADLQDFLDHYYVGMSVLVQEDDFYDLAMAYFERAHRDGCFHSEVFFDPQGHVARGISIDTVICGFDRACKDVNAKLGTTNKLIMCLLRHLDPQDGLNTIENAHKYFENGTLHGLGLDSSEKPFPPHLFAESYKLVAERYPHIGLTAHAGEEGDHTYVQGALTHLGVTRIDHGINTKNDPELMKFISEKQIMLSVCPLSNLKLNVVQDIADLPLRTFFDANVQFSINSDDPAYFGGYILDNYKAVHQIFGFTLDEWAKIAENGIRGSWCDEQRKLELCQILNATVVKYKKLITE